MPTESSTIISITMEPPGMPGVPMDYFTNKSSIVTTFWKTPLYSL